MLRKIPRYSGFTSLSLKKGPNQKEEERAEDNDNEQGIGWIAILVKLPQLFEAPESQKPPKPSIRSLP